MGKIVFAALIGALIWVFFFLKPRKRRARDDRPAPSAPPAGEAPVETANHRNVESMVQCARCGVFMPESDSVLRDGKIGCAKPAQCTHAKGNQP